ncbi:uncharacterized protein LOC143548821 [Bidens hawaiensis]|uniref:uncharacterized protein LOC143548821 n=1 Tax=Bidens hawaiensis TaxID=980011 RepID=UPI0040490D03
MAESRSPQFVMAYTPLSCATCVICAINMVVYISTVSILWSKWSTDCHSFFKEIGMDSEGCNSVYKRSTILIAIIQTVGILLGSIAPICRCLYDSRFRSISTQNLKQFAVLQVEDIWTRQMYGWKIIRLSLLSSVGPRSRASVHGLKNLILIICIGFQKAVVVSCKVIGLVPIVLVNFVQFSLYYLKPTGSNTANTNEDLSNYVLLIEGDTQLTQRTSNRIANSMKCFNKKAEKKQHGNLLNLLGQLEEQLDAST